MKSIKRIDQVLASKTTSITNQVLEMQRAGVDVISLGAGEPDFDTPDHIKKAAIDAINKGYTRYTDTTGIPELKNAIAKKLRNNNNIDVDQSEIIVTCGGKFAIAAAILAICDQGDEVLIPTPYWVSYPEIVRFAGAKPVFIPTNEGDNFALDFEALERSVTKKTKMMIFNNPVNPSGAVYSTKVTDKLANWLKATQIIALTDEIYESIIFDDVKIRSLASYPEIKNQVITVNGVSKTYAMTGWRIGYAACSQMYISQMAKIQSHMTTNPTSISQWAAIAALTGDQIPVVEMCKSYKNRRDFVLNRLSEINGLICTKTQGTFYLFPNISDFFNRKNSQNHIKNSVELCKYLLEEKNVALIPGDAFGAPNHFRISFTTSLEQLKKAMDRIQEGLQILD